MTNVRSPGIDTLLSGHDPMRIRVLSGANPDVPEVSGDESAGMSRLIKLCALAAPGFLLIYGLLRLVDGLDGDRGNGPAWDLGHLAFFVGIVLFAIMAVALRGFERPAARWQRVLIDVAAAAAVFGAGCFLWVITGDLFEDFSDAAPLPGPLEPAGPLLFQAGLLVLLARLVVLRRLPVWSPVAMFLGFAAIAVSLDLLPLAAVLVGAALLPLALPERVRTAS
jgi:hypothetical protein